MQRRRGSTPPQMVVNVSQKMNVAQDIILPASLHAVGTLQEVEHGRAHYQQQKASQLTGDSTKSPTKDFSSVPRGNLPSIPLDNAPSPPITEHFLRPLTARTPPNSTSTIYPTPSELDQASSSPRKRMRKAKKWGSRAGRTVQAAQAPKLGLQDELELGSESDLESES
ncbi:hypothetical protein K443DRAFT_13242 [Laccaria amethystina LaAM-08-1]|jgi:hypothetical protein|uniref:Uncharacterized protein n=1 Tax=Laccaria amethystina LaAM-08-1 TaxID=1095629 RepID=A0A0C9WPL3_9AGAR|nr:hypothetical protein K443DRAFT_13242 [Laccaria amethystina LaAM-08-1]